MRFHFLPHPRTAFSDGRSQMCSPGRLYSSVVSSRAMSLEVWSSSSDYASSNEYGISWHVLCRARLSSGDFLAAWNLSAQYWVLGRGDLSSAAWNFQMLHHDPSGWFGGLRRRSNFFSNIILCQNLRVAGGVHVPLPSPPPSSFFFVLISRVRTYRLTSSY